LLVKGKKAAGIFRPYVKTREAGKPNLLYSFSKNSHPEHEM